MRIRTGIVLSLAAVGLGGLSLAWQNQPAPGVAPRHHAPAASHLRPEPTRRDELPRVHPATIASTSKPRTLEADPLAPLPSLSAQPPSPERSAAIATMVADVGRTDTAGALDLAQALRSGLDDGSLEHRLQIWTEEAPAEGIAWVKALPAGAVRDRLLARAAYVRIQQNPAEALELLQLMSPDPANEPATQAVLKLWHQRDPAGATAWLARNSSSG
jgi:hypothetical protein